MQNIWSEYKLALRNLYEEEKKLFFILSGLFFIAILSILRANYNFLDDMGRVMEGYNRFDLNSRWYTFIMTKLLHGDAYLADISPLPQILAVFNLAFAGALLHRLLLRGKKLSVWAIIALVPLAVSPYSLSLLSYKYDSPYMTASIVFAIFPFLFKNRGKLEYGIWMFIGSLLMCMSYQASNGIFLILIVWFCLEMWNEKKSWKDIAIFVGVSLLAWLLALVLYYAFMTYPSDRNSLPHGLVALITTYFKNLWEMTYYVRRDMKTLWNLCLLLIGAGFVVYEVVVSKRNKLLALFANGVGAILMVVLSFGIYPFLEFPATDLRNLYGIMIAIVIMEMVISEGTIHFLPVKLAGFVLSWCFFGYAFLLGNAFYATTQWTDYRIMEALDGMKELPVFDEYDEVFLQIEGNIGAPPQIANLPEDYYFLMLRAVPYGWTFASDGWGNYGILNYYGVGKLQYEPEKQDIETMEQVAHSFHYDIYERDNHLVIVLKKR